MSGKATCAHCGKPYGKRDVKTVWQTYEIRCEWPPIADTLPAGSVVIRSEALPSIQPMDPYPTKPGYSAILPGPIRRCMVRVVSYWDGHSYYGGYEPFCTLKCALAYARKAYENRLAELKLYDQFTAASMARNFVFEADDGLFYCVVAGRTFGGWRSRAEAKGGLQVEEKRAAARVKMRRQLACISMGTNQCAPICLSRLTTHLLGACAYLDDVWSDNAIAKELARRPDGPLKKD